MLEELEEPTLSRGAPLWYAALGNRLEIARVLLDRGADPNSNVYASGWPLSNAWNHEGGALKRLLLERGARPQPHTLAANHDVVEARRLLENNPSEYVVEELLWSAADHGCPEIVALSLSHTHRPLNDRTAHWVDAANSWRGGRSGPKQRSLRLPRSDSPSGRRSERRAHGRDRTALYGGARWSGWRQPGSVRRHAH
jgi:hypothetical protein